MQMDRKPYSFIVYKSSIASSAIYSDDHLQTDEPPPKTQEVPGISDLRTSVYESSTNESCVKNHLGDSNQLI